MNNNFKNDKFVEVVQEFQIVQGQSVYQIGSIDLKDVYFFVKNGNENYKVLATGQYTVDGVNLTINDPNIILTNTHIQVCRVYSTVASKYISDVVNINTLREHYNVLVDDFINVIDFLRKSGIKSDSSAMNYVFPLLEEGQVFMRKGLGFEGRQIMDINGELQLQINKAVEIFDKYLNEQKKPEIDNYIGEKETELENRLEIFTQEKIQQINYVGLKTFNTIEDMQSMTYLKIGDIAELNGYYTAGDGAGHKRKIEETDDGSGVQLANGLWANIVHSGEVNVSWFGASDSISDNSSILKNAHAFANSEKLKVNYGKLKKLTLDSKDCIVVSTDTDFRECTLYVKQQKSIYGAIEFNNIKKEIISLETFENEKDSAEEDVFYKKTYFHLNEGTWEDVIVDWFSKRDFYGNESDFDSEGGIFHLEKITKLTKVSKGFDIRNLKILIDDNSSKNHQKIAFLNAIDVNFYNIELEIEQNLMKHQKALFGGDEIFVGTINGLLCKSNPKFLPGAGDYNVFGTYLWNHDCFFNSTISNVIEPQKKDDDWYCSKGCSWRNLTFKNCQVNRIDAHRLSSYLTVENTNFDFIKANAYGRCEISKCSIGYQYGFVGSRTDTSPMKISFDFSEILISECILKKKEDQYDDSALFWIEASNPNNLAKTLKTNKVTFENCIFNPSNNVRIFHFRSVQNGAEEISDMLDVKFKNCKLDSRNDFVKTYDKYPVNINPKIKVSFEGVEFEQDYNKEIPDVDNKCFKSFKHVSELHLKDCKEVRLGSLSTNSFSKITIDGCLIRTISAGGSGAANNPLPNNFSLKISNSVFEKNTTHFDPGFLYLRLNTRDYEKTSVVNCILKNPIYNDVLDTTKLPLPKVDEISYGNTVSNEVDLSLLDKNIRDRINEETRAVLPQLTLMLNTPYHATKMQEEGVYDDFVAYMDEKTEYDRLQRELEQQRQLAFEQRENQEQTYEEWLVEQPMLLPVENEPQPSEALLKFKEKYLG